MSKIKSTCKKQYSIIHVPNRLFSLLSLWSLHTFLLRISKNKKINIKIRTTNIVYYSPLQCIVVTLPCWTFNLSFSRLRDACYIAIFIDQYTRVEDAFAERKKNPRCFGFLKFKDSKLFANASIFNYSPVSTDFFLWFKITLKKRFVMKS